MGNLKKESEDKKKYKNYENAGKTGKAEIGMELSADIMTGNVSENDVKGSAGYTKVQKATIFVCVITSFLTTFMGSALNLSVPVMGEEFRVSAGEIGWVVTVYMLISAAFSVSFGRIADITARKRILVTGIATFTAASVMSVFSRNLPMVLAGRGTQGFGASMIFATNQAILISEFEAKDRGRVLGYATAATYLGLAMGPVLGGMLNHYFGWRSIFAISAVIALVILIEAVRKLPMRAHEGDRVPMDTVGSTLYILMILMFVYGLTALAEGGLPAMCLIAGALLAFAFVNKELKTEYPIIDIRLFSGNPAYAFSNIAAFLNYGATYATSYLLSIYFQVVRGYDSQITGLLLITSPVVMTILSPYAGRLSDRISPAKIATIGMTITALTLVILSFLQEDQSVYTVIAINAVSGIGFALFSSPNTNAIMSYVNKGDFAVASSVLATMRSLGQTFNMAIVTITVTLMLGEATLMQAEPEAIMKVMKLLFLIGAGFSAAGIFFSVKRGKSDKKRVCF